MSAVEEGTLDDEASVAKKTRTGNQSLDVALIVITASNASAFALSVRLIMKDDIDGTASNAAPAGAPVPRQVTAFNHCAAGVGNHTHPRGAA